VTFQRVLLLDVSWAPVAVISWMKAVCLVYQDKVDTLAYQEAEAHSPSTTVRLPAVLRLNRPVKTAWQAVRFSRRNVYHRDDYRCQYCGRKLPAHKLNLDHVVPRSRGGRTSWDNVVTSCLDHNRIKGGRLPREAGLRLLRRPQRPSWSPGEKIRATLIGTVPSLWEPYLGEDRSEAAAE